MFSFLPLTNFSSLVKFILSSVNAFKLDQPKILSFGIELPHMPILVPSNKDNIKNMEKSCVGTGVKKPGKTYASPTAII